MDGAAAAAWYGWHVGDRFSYYQAGFDPAWSRYSVGFLLLAETVREAIAEGAAEYDLLVGDEAFKSRFATGERLGSSVLLAPPVSRMRLMASVERVARSGWLAMPRPAREGIRTLRQRIRSSLADRAPIVPAAAPRFPRLLYVASVKGRRAHPRASEHAPSVLRGIH